MDQMGEKPRGIGLRPASIAHVISTTGATSTTHAFSETLYFVELVNIMFNWG